MAREGYRAAELDRLLLPEASRIDDELQSIEKEETLLGVVDDQRSVEEGVVPIADGELPARVSNTPTRDGGGGRHHQHPVQCQLITSKRFFPSHEPRTHVLSNEP
jgi:hypothetical protein